MSCCNKSDMSMHASKNGGYKQMAQMNMGAAGGNGCGCAGAAYAAPQGSCTLAAPAAFAPACHPAAFHAGCCSCCGPTGCYQKMSKAYGY